MADVFYRKEALQLLDGKHIVFFGDSNTRALYKDLVMLLRNNSLILQLDLRKKQEDSFCGDKLGKHTELNRGREYQEERACKINNITVEFYFITKCYNPTLVDMMEDIHLGIKDAPDVIYINSTLWDVSRWGPDGVMDFKDNLQKLARLFKSSLPDTTLVIWGTALPISPSIKSSLLIKQINFLQYTLRFEVLEANNFARQVMASHGFDVLDLHFHMRMQVHRRVHDGVHYFPVAVRFVTNLLLTHLALTWDFPLPQRVDTILLEKAKTLSASHSTTSATEESLQLLSKQSKKGKKQLPAKQTECETTKIYNDRESKNESKPYTLRETLHKKQRRPSKLKGANGRVKWPPGGEGENRRRRQSQSRGRRNRISPWESSQSASWSDDHWPEEPHQFRDEPYDQRFQSDQVYPDRYSTEQRFMNPQRFCDNNMFMNNRFNSSLHQANSTLMELIRRRQLLSNVTSSSRYAPY